MATPDLPGWLIPALDALGKLEKVGTYTEGAFPVCFTKPMREGRGIPFLSRQVAIHTWPDKTVTITPIKATSPLPSKTSGR